MMDVEASYSDFINCDRTGRRNAVPDITREGGQGPASTSELAKDMAGMELKAAGRGGTWSPEDCEPSGRRGPRSPWSWVYRPVVPFLHSVRLFVHSHHCVVVSDFLAPMTLTLPQGKPGDDPSSWPTLSSSRSFNVSGRCGNICAL